VSRFASTAADHYHDVIIVGGGMVGNAMACSLGQSPRLAGCKILVLESGKPKSLGKPPLKYANRVSAVSPGSAELFRSNPLINPLIYQYSID